MNKNEVSKINKSNKLLAQNLSDLTGMTVTYGYSHSPNRYVPAYDCNEAFYTGVRRSCSLTFDEIGINLRFDCLTEDYYNHEEPAPDFGLFTIENVLAYFDRNKTYRPFSHSMDFFKNCLFAKMKIEDALKPQATEKPRNKMKI